MITKIKISGMHCASCKALLEGVCQEIPGVQSCIVDLQTSMATITHDDTFDFANLKKEIAGIDDTYSFTKIL